MGVSVCPKGNQSGLHANLRRDFAYLDRTGSTVAAHTRSAIVAHRIEFPDQPEAIFLAKDVNSSIAQGVARNPTRLEPATAL